MSCYRGTWKGRDLRYAFHRTLLTSGRLDEFLSGQIQGQIGILCQRRLALARKELLYPTAFEMLWELMRLYDWRIITYISSFPVPHCDVGMWKR